MDKMELQEQVGGQGQQNAMPLGPRLPMRPTSSGDNIGGKKNAIHD